MRKKNSKMVELVDEGEGESKIRYRGEEREEGGLRKIGLEEHLPRYQPTGS